MNKISIGILAHNEEQTIPAVLKDLAAQDKIPGMADQLEVVVVVNGSSDQTAENARKTAEKIKPVMKWDFRVVELARAGKDNAWNLFVHEYSRPDAEILILVDADIRLPQIDTLSRLVKSLEKNPGALASVDEPVKSIAMDKGHDLRGHLSVAASRVSAAGPPKLCGQLYAARSEALRNIFLPLPLLVEDGFIKAMLTTDGFSRPERNNALVRAPGAYHLYEAESSMKKLFRHERRIIAGTLCNIILFEYLRKCVSQGLLPAQIIRQNNEQDKDWLRTLIAGNIQLSSRFKDIYSIVLLPLHQWRSMQAGRSFTGFAAALIRTLFNIPVTCAAWLDLRRDRLNW
ncbi:glycosyltransferase [Desulfonatronovibrio magnus]|uniref:glycosyltransferase n=1 Tax=Desulfonatronovibrio magnus TaxID=698827 RepID=UPI0005EB2D3E|nr:glycosyltransferase [Desulfonatronovibrio magnus]